MTVAWLVPLALAGAALAAVPLVIHLLVRQHAQRVSFPSLRFVRASQLAAFRARRIEDAWLLVLRMAIVVVAALALAGPLLQSDSRRAQWASRVSRAVIGIDGDGVGEASAAFRERTFHRARLGDAIEDALRWLDEQPPSSREIVFAGALRRGDVGEAELARIPGSIGVRFDQKAAPAGAEIEWPVLARRDGRLVRIDRAVHLASDATTVSDARITPVRDDLITISGTDQRLADAALTAALDAGVPWRDFDTHVAIALPDDVPVAEAAERVMQDLQRRSPPPRIEPVSLSAEQLSRWTRPAGPPSSTAPLFDEGDRRWGWLAVLALLLAEWRVRQGRVKTAALTSEEARVA